MMEKPEHFSNNVEQIGNYVTTGNFDNPQRGRIYSIYGLAPTCNTGHGGGHIAKFLINGRVRRLTPTEQLRLMGVNESEIRAIKDSKLSDRAIYQVSGNSIVVDVLADIFEEIYNNNEQTTLF